MSISKKQTTSTTPTTTPVTPMPTPTTPATPTTPVTPMPVPTTPPTPTTPATPLPDPNATLAALAQQIVSQLDSLEVQLGSDPPLSPTTKRRSGRMRKGGANILGMITALATQHDLESPAMQTAPITADAGKASALQPLANRLAAFTKHVDDLIFLAQSSAWEGGLQFYAVLQRRAKTDNDLATALQPVTQFFAFRHKTATPAGTPTKPQRKATKKAVGTLRRTAPALLAGSASGAGSAPATAGTALAVGGVAPAAATGTAPAAPGTAPALAGTASVPAQTPGTAHS